MSPERVHLAAEEAEALARAHGTPFYLYDLDVLVARVRRARAALGAAGAQLLYAVKANPNHDLLRALHGEVDGLDLSSGGELELAVRAGWDPRRASFAGPGKTREELEAALAAGALVSVESVRELDDVAALAASLGRRALVRLRLNPAKAALAYRVRMIGGPSPFGIDEEELPAAISRLRAHAGVLELEGVHVHPGGQCTSLGGFSAALGATLELAERLVRDHQLDVRSVNLGGGFGVLSEGPVAELDVAGAGARLAQAIARWTANLGRPLVPVLELGRWLAAPAGLWVARVVSEKASRGTTFTVLDGGMNQHLAATGHLYGPSAPRLPLVNLSRPEAPRAKRTVVGPLCTPLDTLGTDLELPTPALGDLIAVRDSGAYGYTFSPLLFLGHPLPAELVRAGGLVRTSRAKRSVASLLLDGE